MQSHNPSLSATAYLFSEEDWSRQLDAFGERLQDALDQNQYPRLLSDLAFCVKLVVHPETRFSETGLQNFLVRFEKACLALDDCVQEYNFRHYLTKQFLQPLFQDLNKKLSESTKTALKLPAFFKALRTEKLIDSEYGQVNLHAFYEQKIWGFQHFFNPGHQDKRFESLKERHSQHAQALANQLGQKMDRGSYTILSEWVLSYWKTLAAQYPDRFKAANKRVLLELGDGLWHAVTIDPKRKTLYPSILILQQLLAEAMPDDGLFKACRAKVFGEALITHHHAAPIGSNTPENALMNQSISLLKQSSTHLKTITLSDSEPCALFEFDLKQERLRLSRMVYQSSHLNLLNNPSMPKILAAQKAHTEDVLSLLKDMVTQAIRYLGVPAAEIAFCVLGSTSRYDRRPYSDVEFMVLYQPLPHVKDNRDWVEFYVFQVISLVEMQIIALGETHHKDNPNAGFHVDSSAHVFAKGLWGTPEQMAKKFVTELAQIWDKPDHPWASDESFYSLLQPVRIPTDSPGSVAVFEHYQAMIQSFLQAPCAETDCLAKMPSVLRGLKRHQAIAWLCLQDVVQKSVETLKTLKPGAIK